MCVCVCVCVCVCPSIMVTNAKESSIFIRILPFVSVSCTTTQLLIHDTKPKSVQNVILLFRHMVTTCFEGAKEYVDGIKPKQLLMKAHYPL